MPRLFPFPQNTLASIDTQHIQTFYFKQVLDYFNYKLESFTTFDKKYMINFKHWTVQNLILRYLRPLV